MAAVAGTWCKKVLLLILFISTRCNQATSRVSFTCDMDAPLDCEATVICTCVSEDNNMGTSEWIGDALLNCDGGTPVFRNSRDFGPPDGPVTRICNDGGIIIETLGRNDTHSTSRATIMTQLSMNGTIIQCGLFETPFNGSVQLTIGEKPSPAYGISLPIDNINPESFRLNWTDTGANNMYIVKISSDDETALCATSDNVTVYTTSERFGDWLPRGQVCTMTVITVSNDNCNIQSDPSTSVSILLQGPVPSTVERVELNQVTYDASNQGLISVSLNITYLPQAARYIVEGLSSNATDFNITAGDSCFQVSPLCGMTVCTYLFDLSTCLTDTSTGDEIDIGVVPVNPVASGDLINTTAISQRNNVFAVSGPSGRVSSPSVNINVTSAMADNCQVSYGLGENCDNFTVTPTSSGSNLFVFRLTVTDEGVYCYRVRCFDNEMPFEPITQGRFVYSELVTTTTDVPTEEESSFPWWIIVVVILIIIALGGGGGGAGGYIGYRHYKNKQPAKRNFNSREVESADDKADLATYADPNSIEHQHAPGGEEYALVDKSSRKVPEASGALYQDPNTIKHEEAVSGDVYTVVEKKPKKGSKKTQEQPSEQELAQMYSVPDKSKKNQGGLTYAELNLPGGGNVPVSHPTEYATVVD